MYSTWLNLRTKYSFQKMCLNFNARSEGPGVIRKQLSRCRIWVMALLRHSMNTPAISYNGTARLLTSFPFQRRATTDHVYSDYQILRQACRGRYLPVLMSVADSSMYKNEIEVTLTRRLGDLWLATVAGVSTPILIWLAGWERNQNIVIAAW